MKMVGLPEVWNWIKTSASIITSTGFLAYGVKEIRKRFQKPELAASIEIIGKTHIIPCMDITPIEGGTLHTRNGYCDIEQEWILRITNNSEYPAFKLRLVAPQASMWEPEIDYTRPILAHQTSTTETHIEFKVKVELNEASFYKRHPVIENIRIEYQNSIGRKFYLTFKPNEPDVSKRNICVNL